MGTHSKKQITRLGYVDWIDISICAGRILTNMVRDHASILMEVKTKRMPTFTTSVVGSGRVAVNQEKDKDLL